jgi:3-mercaptopyruvate sulfurtransferase SseA
LILRFLSSSLSFSCFSGSLSSVSMRMLTTAGLTMSVLYFLGSGCYWVILERLALS